uniref:Uncharacterized protein n=1 Tax=Caenorhabditis japonica TaxID=281687 RepID=A0A8R1J1D9_CAEJA
MLRNLFTLVSRRFASSDSPRKVVVCANGTIAAWHPPQEFPYEHSKSIDLDALKNKDQQLSSLRRRKASAVPREPVNAELKEIFILASTSGILEPVKNVSATSPLRFRVGSNLISPKNFQKMHLSRYALQKSTVNVIDLGLISYGAALEKQQKFVELVKANKSEKQSL